MYYTRAQQGSKFLVWLLILSIGQCKEWQRAYLDPDGSVMVPLPADLASDEMCLTLPNGGPIECLTGVQIPSDEPVVVVATSILSCSREKTVCPMELQVNQDSVVKVLVYRARNFPFVAVTWPPVGYITIKTPLEVFFRIAGTIPVEAAWIRVDFPGSKQSPFLLQLSTSSVVLDRIEPGTHLLGFTLVDVNEIAVGPREEISFDLVLPDSDLSSHRLVLDTQKNKAVLLDMNGPTDFNNKKSTEAIRLVFVGSSKMDGQKTIWLEQFARLDRTRYDMSFVSFMQESIEEQSRSTLAIKLQDQGIPMILEPIPIISFEEAAESPRQGKALNYDGRQATVDTYLLERLDMARDDPKQCEPRFVRRTWTHLVTVFQRLRADIIIFANARESSDALLTRAARLGRPTAKLVMELPNLFPHPDALDAVHVLVAPSHYAARHHSVTEALRNRSIPVIVVNPGIDATVFNLSAAIPYASDNCHPHCRFVQAHNKQPCAAACDTVGFLARVAPEKSPGLIIHAAAIVLKERPFTRFVIVGSGDSLPALSELARAYGIQDAFHFAGPVYGAAKIAQRYAAFDLVVNPSLRAWSETFCIANIEAMALARPVISFGIGGIGEYFKGQEYSAQEKQDDQNGILLTSTDPTSLAEAILSLLQDPDKRRRLGESAHQTVIESFLVQDQILKYDHLYSSLHLRQPLPPYFFTSSGHRR